MDWRVSAACAGRPFGRIDHGVSRAASGLGLGCAMRSGRPCWVGGHFMGCGAPAAILTDVFSGVDVTELVKTPPLLPGHSGPTQLLKSQSVLRNREYYMLILELVLL